jgi:hypothetical protein
MAQELVENTLVLTEGERPLPVGPPHTISLFTGVTNTNTVFWRQSNKQTSNHNRAEFTFDGMAWHGMASKKRQAWIKPEDLKTRSDKEPGTPCECVCHILSKHLSARTCLSQYLWLLNCRMYWVLRSVYTNRVRLRADQRGGNH